MPTALNATLREVSERLVAWGMITEAIRDAAVREEGDDADHIGHFDWAAVFELFRLGLYVSATDVDDLEESYRDVLEELADLSDGAIVVDEVALGEDEDGEELLTFLVNGQPHEWEVEHDVEDQLDMDAIAEWASDLAPGDEDPRVFFHMRYDDGGDDDWLESLYVLATPGQVAALRDEYALPLAAV